jgi:uncharacterized protein
MDGPFLPVADGLKLRVRLTPRACRPGIDGLVADAEGALALKVAVTAAPEKGAANAALIRLLAKEWHLPASSITLAAGAADRRKLLHLAGDPKRLAAAVEDWLARHAT